MNMTYRSKKQVIKEMARVWLETAYSEITARASRDYVSCLTSRNLGMTFLLLMVGVNTVWAQDPDDYSGTYFIANGNGYNSTDATKNFYLVPATNSNYENDAQKPHLTTDKTGQVLNCCWQIVKKVVILRLNSIWIDKHETSVKKFVQYARQTHGWSQGPMGG